MIWLIPAAILFIAVFARIRRSRQRTYEPEHNRYTDKDE